MRDFLKLRYAHFTRLQFTIMFLLCGCIPTRSIDTVNQMHFRTIGRIPVVEGKINGKHAYFIMDTGASVSILNECVSEHFGFKFILVNDQQVVGLGGQAKINQAFNCVVEFGSLKVHSIVFRTKRMGDFVAAIQQHENISIAGIIGADVLARYNITIDFRNHTISF